MKRVLTESNANIARNAIAAVGQHNQLFLNLLKPRTDASD